MRSERGQEREWSVVIPVYNSQASLPWNLIERLSGSCPLSSIASRSFWSTTGADES